MQRTLFVSIFLVGCSGAAPTPVTTQDAGSDTGSTSSADSSSPGDGCTYAADVNGTFLGATMTPQDAFFIPGDPANGTWAFMITDYVGACGMFQALEEKGGSKLIGFRYTQAPAPTVGTYPVGDTSPWQIQYESVNATCSGGANDLAIAGTITITSVSSCGVAATFDLTFGGSSGNSNEHVTGSVSAPTCAIKGGGAATCK